MEKSRNIDFESEVEVDSLKDAVWRLTTRVYLLEDFIAETFGQVIGPTGFTKASMITTPSSSKPQSTTVNSATSSSQYQPSTSNSGRKRRKRHHVSTSLDQTEGRDSKMQKNPGRSMDSLNEGSNSSIGVQLDSEQSESGLLLIPKDEILQKDGGDVDVSDYFLGDKSDDDEEDPNDSTAQDPDFDPLRKTERPGRFQEKTMLVNCQLPLPPTPESNKRKELFYEKLKTFLASKAFNNRTISTTQYQKTLERLKILAEGGKRILTDTNIIRRFILIKSGNDQYIANKSTTKKVVASEDIFDILESTHLATKHGGRDVMKKHVNQMYDNVTREQILLYLSVCEECQLKKAKLKNPSPIVLIRNPTV